VDKTTLISIQSSFRFQFRKLRQQSI